MKGAMTLTESAEYLTPLGTRYTPTQWNLVGLGPPLPT